ncbi:hypothetical protein EV360DRAFT_76990 [Lentinula raphanica]|nr:hypothetical protein EV360DRAFT_76990 [Lentinula raphanica]
MSTFMRLFLSLSNELLHFVIEYIAFGPVLPEDFKNFVSRSRFTRPSLALLVLSVANRRVHQICLSFLFASSRIHKYNVEKLDEHVALFSRFTKTLVIEDLFPLGYTIGHRIIKRILSQLEQIRYVELRHSRIASGLLRTEEWGTKEAQKRERQLRSLEVTLSGYSRTPPESFSELEKSLDHGMKLAWYVKVITLKSNSATTSLIQMLTLAASAFPELKVLTLRLEFHEAKYDVGDFVSVFAQFFSLRVVFLHDVYKRLIFESANDNSMPSPPVKITVYRAPNPDETILIIPAASGILQITSLLAKQNKTLDFFSFKDEISRDEDGQLSCPGPGSGKLVFLKGELQVLNSNWDVDASFMVYSTPGSRFRLDSDVGGEN